MEKPKLKSTIIRHRDGAIGFVIFIDPSELGSYDVQFPYESVADGLSFHDEALAAMSRVYDGDFSVIKL